MDTELDLLTQAGAVATPFDAGPSQNAETQPTNIHSCHCSAWVQEKRVLLKTCMDEAVLGEKRVPRSL